MNVTTLATLLALVIRSECTSGTCSSGGSHEDENCNQVRQTCRERKPSAIEIGSESACRRKRRQTYREREPDTRESTIEDPVEAVARISLRPNRQFENTNHMSGVCASSRKRSE